MAARLLTLDAAQFRRTLWDHGLPEGPDHSLMWVEQVLERPVTETDYLAAERQGDKRADRNRRHYEKQRTAA
jgi:hypothetical protein